MLILPFYEYEIYFHFFVSSSVSFSDLIVFIVQVFHLLCKVYSFLSSLFFFHCKWDCFLHFFVVSIWKQQLCVYWFFYPATWLDLFLFLKVFWWGPLGFSIYKILLLANSDSFTPFFSIWMFFISCLIVLARPSCTMLNKNGESVHRCLVPDLRGKGFNFYLLTMMLTLVFSCMAFIMFRYFYTHFINSFYHSFILYLVQCLFCICWDNHDNHDYPSFC